MPIETIDDLGDHRLAPYRLLKQTNLTRWSGQFIAEGERVVRRLLSSRFVTRSILLSERKLRLAEEPAFSQHQVLILAQPLADELVGYRFHAGVLACGERTPAARLETLLDDEESARPQVAVVCPHITDPDNLGTIIRLCAGFGAGPLILGPGSSDPLSRRSLRISMGYALHLPVVESDDLQRDLDSLRARRFTLAATVLGEAAIPLHKSATYDRIALLFGNESDGLDPRWVDAAKLRLTIPMSGGTDSLNVSLAAGIFLHHFCRAADRYP